MGILQSAVALLEAGESFVLATIVEQQGSTPRDSGTQMIIRSDGRIIGTIGGGSSEAQVMATSSQLIKNRSAQYLTINMTGKDAAESDMICGGIVKILMQTIQPVDLPALRKARAAEENRQKGWLVTLIENQRYALVFIDDEGRCICGSPLPEPLQDLCRDATKSAMHTQHIKDITLHAQPLHPQGQVYIFGAGHVALDTAKICALLGFETTVLDDRTEFLNPQRYPSSHRVLLDDFQHIPDLPVDKDTYIIIMTRGHLADKQCLDWALARDCKAAYIGMIGSLRKRNLMYDQLRQEGIAEDRIARIHSPIGLRIEAQTPAEIAVSIAAELIQQRNGQTGI